MPSSTNVPLQIAGYTILTLSLPPLPSFPQSATHYLYLAPHQPKIPTSTASRSLFLVNVPFDSTETHIKHLLSTQIDLSAGRIENVQFEGQRRKAANADGVLSAEPKQDRKANKKRKRGSNGVISDDVEGTELPSTWDRDLQSNGLTAVVLFVDKASMDAALKAVKAVRKKNIEPIWGEGIEDKVPALGSARYLNHHQLTYPDKGQILESTNNFMTKYAAKEASRARLATKQRQEPDEDGFITVTRGGRTNPAKQELAQESAEKQKEKQKGLDDFYRFQSWEKRKERAGELVRKFEEDKQRVRKMKEQRGIFRPE